MIDMHAMLESPSMESLHLMRKQQQEMDVNHAHLVVTITADAACYERVERICRERGALSARLASDPADLPRLLHLEPLGPLDRPLATGIILDLTYPIPSTPDSPSAAGTLEIAAHLTRVLEGLSCIEHHAFIVISAEPGIEELLRQRGIPVSLCIAPAADDAIWRQALAVLLLSADPDGAASGRGSMRLRRPPARVLPSATAMPLSPTVWFEPSRAILLQRGREMTLTLRESALLTILLQVPCRYVTTDQLAQRLSQGGLPPVGRHSVEQTVSDVRRKLGESAQHPRLLLMRRGFGYGMFPRTSDAVEANSPAVVRTRATSKT